MADRAAQQHRIEHFAAALALLAAGVAVYANSFDGVFLFDDRPAIVDQDRIRQLWPPWAWLGSRRPVVDFTLAVNFQAGGLDPWGYHLVNLLVHLCAGLTLFGLVRRTLSRTRDSSPKSARHRGQGSSPGPRAACWFAFSVALLWLVHPLQTQSVTYLVQRAEAMMGLFYLLTLYCMVRGAETDHPVRWYVLAVAACVLGMGSKAVMVTAPVVALLYDRIFIARSWKHVWRQRWGLYVGLFATLSILWKSGVAPSVLATENERATVGFAYEGIAPVEYALTQAGVILHYLRLAFWPDALCLDYAWPVTRSFGAALLPLGGLFLMLTLTAVGLGTRPKLGFLGAAFFLILAPTSSLIPIKDPLFEHRMYLPLAPVITLSLLALRAVALRLSGFQERNTVTVMVSAVVAAAAGLGYKTMERNRDYASELGMWRDIAVKRPGNARAHYSIGTILIKRQDWNGAIAALRRATEADPEYADAHYNLGNALRHAGQPREAIAAYREAIHLKPDLDMARLNLANVLQQVPGGLTEAISQYRAAIRTDPKMAVTHLNLGKALVRAGRLAEAVRSFREAARLEPENPQTHFALGMGLQGLRRYDEAAEEFRTTLRVQPDHLGARRALEGLPPGAGSSK